MRESGEREGAKEERIKGQKKDKRNSLMGLALAFASALSIYHHYGIVCIPWLFNFIALLWSEKNRAGSLLQFYSQTSLGIPP
jgi:hypothetical protein